eukprot:g29636.t1
MSDFDYVTLGQPIPNNRRFSPLRTAAAVCGAVMAAVTSARIFRSSDTHDEVWTPYTPRAGMDSAVVRAGPGGALQLLAPPAHDAESHCLFLYESPKKLGLGPAFRESAESREGWLYGAKVVSRGPTGQLAELTGHPEDVLKGSLLCWDAARFPAKLEALDRLKGYEIEWEVRRELAPIVLKDGSTKQAYVHYKVPQEGELDKESLHRFECPVCHAFLKNDAHLKVHVRSHNPGGRGQSGFECDMCYAQFKTSGMLRQHVRHEHADAEYEEDEEEEEGPVERGNKAKADGPEHALLVSLITDEVTVPQAQEHLDELQFLVETAGAKAVHRVTQRLPHPEGRTFIGKGKVEEIQRYLQEHEDINMVVFDDDLSGKQTNALEEAFRVKIIDRSSLILDIFANRAQTAQAKAQVELAQMKYLLPRLRGLWTHLDRQKGGIGMRGPGETEIETDRRQAQGKIKLLEERLKSIDRVASTQRQKRGQLIRVALVGYTNVGKSTLMNLLAKQEVVLAENKLFATLDTTVRKVVFQDVAFLLSDTVGFIRKLPTHLVESFKSTLDEVREADILLHVVDVSHPQFEDHVRTVQRTLEELGAHQKPTLVVYNKVDAAQDLHEHDLAEKLKLRAFGDYVMISAKEKTGVAQLKQKITDMVKTEYTIRYPHQAKPY